MRPTLLFSLFAAACSPLAPGGDLCPPGQGPQPTIDHAQPLATGENHPVSLALLGGTAYFADQGPPGQAVKEGSIVAVSICSGAERVLARQQARPSALVVAGGAVYWVNTGLNDGEGEVYRIPTDGVEGDAIRLSGGEARPAALAVEGDQIYWVNRGKVDAMGVSIPQTGALRRLDRAGGAAKTVVDQLDSPSAISVAGGLVVFATEGRGALVDHDPASGKMELVPTYAKESGAVYRLAPGASVPDRIADAQDSPVAVAQDGAQIYWLDRGLYRASGSVQRTEGPPLGSGLDFPGGFALDGSGAGDATAVYLAVTGASDEHEEGHILRQGLDGQSFDLASSQQLPTAIAVDRHLVAWVNFGDLATTNGQLSARFR